MSNPNKGVDAQDTIYSAASLCYWQCQMVSSLRACNNAAELGCILHLVRELADWHFQQLDILKRVFHEKTRGNWTAVKDFAFK